MQYIFYLQEILFSNWLINLSQLIKKIFFYKFIIVVFNHKLKCPKFTMFFLDKYIFYSTIFIFILLLFESFNEREKYIFYLLLLTLTFSYILCFSILIKVFILLYKNFTKKKVYTICIYVSKTNTNLLIHINL